MGGPGGAGWGGMGGPGGAGWGRVGPGGEFWKGGKGTYSGTYCEPERVYLSVSKERAPSEI